MLQVRDHLFFFLEEYELVARSFWTDRRTQTLVRVQLRCSFCKWSTIESLMLATGHRERPERGGGLLILMLPLGLQADCWS